MITAEPIELLKKLIEIPSFSKEEDQVCDYLQGYFEDNAIQANRQGNNLWMVNEQYHASKPTLLLNSHIDTVRPNKGWTKDPHRAILEDGKLYGLGSNDAGGPLVSLIATFLSHYQEQMAINIVLACTAEEEISGANGIASLEIKNSCDFGIVGEPTLCQVAIAEKGLMVIDAVANGQSGHAARSEGENAIYKALKDINLIEHHPFDQHSKWLGGLKMSVTQIEAGTQHNVVPDRCKFVIDVRTTEHYPNEKLFHQLEEVLASKLKARSFRLNPSFIDDGHPLVQVAHKLGLTCYGSPTLSDQALLNIPTIKIGPGDSARSHTSDEFIFTKEIEKGIATYSSIIRELNKYYTT